MLSPLPAFSADLRWVRRALDNLGGELRRRLVAAGIARGPSLAALQCLNQLLFGEGPPAGHPAAAHIPVPAPFGLGLSGNTSAYYAWANRRAGWEEAWPAGG